MQRGDEEIDRMTTSSPVSQNSFSGALQEEEIFHDIISILPIIKLLPNLVLDESGLYYIDGVLTPADLVNFKAYAGTIDKITITDAPSQEANGTISPETLFRISQLQDPHTPFLPSLQQLCIIDADLSLSHLFFCASPSLQTLEVVHPPDSRQTTFSSFLKELVHHSPGISDIRIGPGSLSDTSLRILPSFSRLNRLELTDVASTVDFAFLNEVSELPDLQTFVIDARKAVYRAHAGPQSPTTAPTQPGQDNENPQSLIADSTFEEGLCRHPFRCLKMLAIVGNITLIGDIVWYLYSEGIKEVSLTLIRSNSVKTPSWHSRVADREQISEGEVTPIVDDTAKSQDHDVLESNAHSTTENGEISIPDVAVLETVKKKKKSPLGKSKTLKKTTKVAPVSTITDLETMNGAAEHHALEFVSDTRQTRYFEEIINLIFKISVPETVAIDHAATETGPSKYSLPRSTFETLISNFNLIHLSIDGWKIDAMEQVFIEVFVERRDPVGPSWKLETLRLPATEDNDCGIEVSTLRVIANHYPALTQFRCAIIRSTSDESLQCATPADAISHGLEFLYVAGGFVAPKPLPTARYLYLLFPHLKHIITSSVDKDVQEAWQAVHDFVKLCQTARAFDLTRT